MPLEGVGEREGMQAVKESSNKRGALYNPTVIIVIN